MMTKLILILTTLYGASIYGQEDGSNINLDLEMFKNLNSDWGHEDIKGDTDPKYLKQKMGNCLLSIDIINPNSIKLIFIDKETASNVLRRSRGQNILKILPKGLLCFGVISGTKILKIDDKFLFYSDRHHISTSLRLVEINKERVVFEYTNNSFLGFSNSSSTEKGTFNLALDLYK